MQNLLMLPEMTHEEEKKRKIHGSSQVIAEADLILTEYKSYGVVSSKKGGIWLAK